MSSFCGNSVFWNASFFDNSWPHFTRCFEETALTIGPCGWLWLTSIAHIMYLAQKVPLLEMPTSTIYLAKLLLSACLTLVSLIHLLIPINQLVQGDDNVAPSSFLSHSLWVISFLYSIILQRMSQKIGINAPCILFIFWFLSAVCTIVPVYTSFATKSYNDDLVDAVLIWITFGLIITQLIFQFFAEKNYKFLQPQQVSIPSRYNGEAFPAKLTFTWMFTLVYHGYKHIVQVVELPDLPPYLQCQNVVPPFLKKWHKEVSKIYDFRKKEKSTSSEGYQRSGEMELRESSETTKLLGSKGSKEKGGKGNYMTLPLGADVNTYEKNVSLYMTLYKTYFFALFKPLMIGMIGDALNYVNPTLLKTMIAYAQDKSSYQQWYGVVVAICMFLVVLLKSLTNGFRFFRTYNVGSRIRTVLTAAVYRKSLTMSADARQRFTIGTTVNLMAVDCQRFQDFTSNMNSAVSSPIQLGIGFYLLYNEVGISFLAGVAVLIMMIPILATVSNLAKKAQIAQITIKDGRVRMMNEMLNGIRVVKLYAWEPSFRSKVIEIRQQELRQLKKAILYQAMNTLSWILSPLLMTLATFITFVFVSPDHTLTPSQAFVSLSIFNMIRQPMNSLPNFISSFIQVHVSMKRLRNYLAGEELEEVDTSKATDKYPVIIDNATFSWSRSIPPMLKNISIKIPRGKLVAVVGQVGAGKSSVLSALLGEMSRQKGYASIKGSVGYVPQQAWVQNKTLKDNILFGKEFNNRFYKKVVNACALGPDIALLPGGENTEIGEKGINLSGGQKQRISLARAVYQESDVFLLDDPLSAVDAHVGKHIFEHVIGPKGLIRHKTRILVTHGIHWLPMVDEIIVIDQGRITEVGSYEKLMEREGHFAQFVKTYLLEHQDEETDDPQTQMIKDQLETVLSDDERPRTNRSLSIISDKSYMSDGHLSMDMMESIKSVMSVEEEKELKENEVLIKQEAAEIGKVKRSVYQAVFKAFGYFLALGVVLFLLTFNGFNVGGSLWLTEWTSDPFLQNVSNYNRGNFLAKTEYYLGIYSLFGILQGIFNSSYVLLIMTQFINASQILHNGMLDNILHQKVTFFDTTPIGRILNRFARDVDVCDAGIGRQLRLVLQYLLSITSTVIVISYTAPVFLAVMVPIGILYYYLQKFYIPSSRQFRRLESITRSPIFSSFSETISGASSIRAFKAGDRFCQENEDLLGKNNQCTFATTAASRWLRVRLDLLGNCIVLFTGLFAVFSDSVNAAMVGLSISYALQVTDAFNMLIQWLTQLETNSVSIERIVEYSKLPIEPAWINEDKRPAEKWPDQGKVEYHDYSTRYRPGLDLVLKNVSFTINPSEKIGIVGRTGSGKSSLSLSLFRVIEAATGSIVIDGVDISTLGLHDLRSRLTILPQDPVLFSGTLRFNLDPFEDHRDNEIWQALDNAHLGEYVRNLPGTLNSNVEEGGQNLSVGQRQLLCLARSLLRKTKILVLDEATAAVDLETDHLLQQTIREAFKDCTVFTVAHRLKTVMDYDRIMVLSQGEIMEFDKPDVLLENEESIFYGLAKESGIV